ncbi:hypothetical protein [Serratia marcescens]|uniref:hypothetical protein n=1 Tax=Serratia marcescens TaxID=615 RepID=UPI0025AA6A3F|nr:hypothetical protein [Serratia marcescens]MDN0028639.1 hypothetical protein [Serratia marcescens]
MIETEFLTRDFGLKNPPPDELMQAVLKFMMAFFYCEDRFFQRKCGFWKSKQYAQLIYKAIKADLPDINLYYDYFKKRYITGNDADRRILSLIPTDLSDFDAARVCLNRIFSINDNDNLRKIEAILYVTIRLRNNLFHANKHQSINDNPLEQAKLIEVAASFYSEILVRTN